VQTPGHFSADGTRRYIFRQKFPEVSPVNVAGREIAALFRKEMIASVTLIITRFAATSRSPTSR
jgi:hypothetical protein